MKRNVTNASLVISIKKKDRCAVEAATVFPGIFGSIQAAPRPTLGDTMCFANGFGSVFQNQLTRKNSKEIDQSNLSKNSRFDWL